MEEIKGKHVFYVLHCKDQSLYAGYTNNLVQRIDRHNQGLGAKYTRPQTRRPVSVIYAEIFSNKIEAMQAEYRFKQLTRQNKIHYLNQHGQQSIHSKHLVVVDRTNEGVKDEETT